MLLKKMVTEDDSIVTLYYGEAVSEQAAQAMAEKVASGLC